MKVRIDGMATDGRGVAHVAGAACFVAGAVVGDFAEIELDMSARPALGTLLSIVEPSPQRTAHCCSHAAECGGSPWGVLAYAAQMEQKRALVQRTLSKLLGPLDVPPVVASPREWNYRSRVTLHVWRADNRVQIGYRMQPRGVAGVAVTTCALAAPAVAAGVAALARFFKSANGRRLPELPRRIQVHATAAGAGVLLIYSGRAYAQQHAEWSAQLDNDIAPGGVWSAAGTRAGILDLRQPVQRSPRALPLRTQWGKHDLDLHPAAFCQVNTAAAGLVIAQAAKWGTAQNFGHVWDLYGGYGALGMAAANGRPLAVFDVSPYARDGLKQLSALAGNPHAKFVSGDLLRTLPGYGERIADNDLVILDPPRSGAHAELLRRIGASRARQVWYLSCNPARLARDLLLLRASGFAIESLQPFDLFPQTPVTEVFVQLRRT